MDSANRNIYDQISDFVKQKIGSYRDTYCFLEFPPPAVMAGLVPAIHGLQPMTSWDIEKYCVLSICYL